MMSWKRRQKIEAKKRKAAEAMKRADIRAASKALAKVLPHFNPKVNRFRYDTIQRATDILAGRAIYG